MFALIASSLGKKEKANLPPPCLLKAENLVHSFSKLAMAGRYYFWRNLTSDGSIEVHVSSRDEMPMKSQNMKWDLTIIIVQAQALFHPG